MRKKSYWVLIDEINNEVKTFSEREHAFETAKCMAADSAVAAFQIDEESQTVYFYRKSAWLAGASAESRSSAR